MGHHDRMTVKNTLRKTCAGCGAVYDGAAWRQLAVVERIEVAELRRLVSTWADDACVEVRACSRCQRPVATRAAAPLSARWA